MCLREIEGFVNLHLVSFNPNDPDICQTGHLSDKPAVLVCLPKLVRLQPIVTENQEEPHNLHMGY
jgi:hypothetical protein